uniref:Uncharacterized protein n=1 Tax=Opuntia streptacantha TaxID=393608 RepID=A0A7C9B1N7_OPUST
MHVSPYSFRKSVNSALSFYVSHSTTCSRSRNLFKICQKQLFTAMPVKLGSGLQHIFNGGHLSGHIVHILGNLNLKSLRISEEFLLDLSILSKLASKKEC